MVFLRGLAAVLCLGSSALLGQGGVAAGDAAHRTAASSSLSASFSLSVDAINRNPTGTPPRNAVWSPDGRLLTYLVEGGQSSGGVGEPGDILAVDAATGKARVLASAAQLSSLGGAAIDEKDRDHRARYGMSGFFWAPDGKHLLLDQGGVLWLYDIAAGKGTLIVDTHAGSGDDPKFSPDGRSVSYLRDHNLYVHAVDANPPANGEVALTATTAETLLNGELDWVYLEELDARSNYFWSPDGKAVAYLQMDEAKVPTYPIEDFIPGHATLDRQRYPQPGDPNPGVRVGVVPAGGGATQWIDVPLSAGNDYIPRFGWVDAKTLYIQVLTRDQQHLNLYFADAASGQTRLVHSETDSKYLEDNYDITLLPHGRFLNTSWRDGHTHLYLYGFDEAKPLGAEAKLLRQLTTGDYEVGSVAAPATGESVFFDSTEGSPLESNLWTMRLDGTGKRRVTAGHGVHETMLSPDGSYFSDQVSTLATPPEVKLCATGVATATVGCKPVWTSQSLGPVAGAKMGFVTLRAADGTTTLYGTLTQPARSAGAKTVPIILNPYGGPIPFAGVRDAWDGLSGEFSELMAQHGFAVLTVDNRGSGGRGRDFQQADYRNFGAVQLADQLAALDQVLAANPQFDPKRVGWWGWSWGGTFTLYAMTHTDRIKAGVAVAPVTDFRNYDSIYTERYLGLPAANPEVYNAASVTAAAGNLKGRAMIAQGTGDDNVHLANTVQFLQPLIDAGIPYDLQLFPRLTHSIAGLNARDELFNRIVWQFETYLKPVAGQP
jgi:dipeptidyl-peptidase-4